jgi:hypothetical protein
VAKEGTGANGGQSRTSSKRAQKGASGGLVQVNRDFAGDCFQLLFAAETFLNFDPMLSYRSPIARLHP